MREQWRKLELFTTIETSSKDFKLRTSGRDSPLLTPDSKVTSRTQGASWSFTPRYLLYGSVSFWQATLNTCVWE